MSATPRVVLLYSPSQFGPREIAKPDGSLSLPYLAGALRQAGCEVAIVDGCVGTSEDELSEVFYRPTPLDSGLVRVGLSRARILEEVADCDVVGIPSIFTAQTTMVLETIRLIRNAFPDKLIVTGGVNARSLAPRFFDAGVDLVAQGESEQTIVAIVRTLQEGRRDFRDVPGLAVQVADRICTTPPPEVVSDLDELPLPAWDLLPLDRYWTIARPHGGDFSATETVRYASMMTSRGCPLCCSYCHISRETRSSSSGPIGALRLESLARVRRELDVLQSLGVEHVFLEDDSFLAKRRRSLEILDVFSRSGLQLADVNGVNVAHLFRRRGSRLVVDQELVEALAQAGFTSLTLAFESASQRILDTYASRKWRVDRLDTVALVEAVRAAGIADVHGNYMIGYPDETLPEMHATIDLARRHMAAGLRYALFFAVVPFPGSALFERAIDQRHLSPDFDPDLMKWTHPIMQNTTVSAEAIEQLRQGAWLEVNRPEYVRSKLDMVAAELGG